jgi:glucose-6-phosphate 1-dehydrogenase
LDHASRRRLDRFLCPDTLPEAKGGPERAAGHFHPSASTFRRRRGPRTTSGDLTRRLLVPSLFELALKGLLPVPFAVLGFSLEEWSDDDFRRQMRQHLEQREDFDAVAWSEFAARLYYLPGNFTSKEDFQLLARRIARLREELTLPDNLYFHLATPPAFFGRVAKNLDRATLARSERATESGWRRIVIEKPFGAVRTSARALHDELQTVFRESQIFRMDHFLGKETLQNMLVFRFANPSFEPIWSHRFCKPSSPSSPAPRSALRRSPPSFCTRRPLEWLLFREPTPG